MEHHAPADSYLGQHKADEVPQGKLRPLQLFKRRRRGKNADGKKQDKEPIADPHQSRVDVDDNTPYRAALEGLRRLRD